MRDGVVSGKDGLDLACEPQPAGVFAKVQGSDAESVAREGQDLVAGVPDRQRKLAVEAGETVVAPLFVGMNDDLRVASGAKAMTAGTEVGAKLEVVEDLTVEDDPDAVVLVGHGLLTGAQIDDRQPGVPKCRDPVPVQAELVRPSMLDGPDHALQVIQGQRGHAFPQGDRAGDPAHGQPAWSGSKTVDV